MRTKPLRVPEELEGSLFSLFMSLRVLEKNQGVAVMGRHLDLINQSIKDCTRLVKGAVNG